VSNRDKLVVFVTPSGYYHATNNCTGMGRWAGKNNRQATLFRKDYEDMWSQMHGDSLIMCRCLRHNDWGQQVAKAELRARINQWRSTLKGRYKV
jgi:hypothetical protein